jgi:hypothetical protein
MAGKDWRKFWRKYASKDGGIGIMGRGRPAIGLMREPVKPSISKQDKKDLKILADDFCILNRADVQEIINTCKSYAEGQQKIMRIYEIVYM